MSRRTPEELMAGLARAGARKTAPPLEEVVGTRDRPAPRGNRWRRVVNALIVVAFAAAVIGGSWGVMALRGSPDAGPIATAAGTNATPRPTSSATIGANHVGLAGFVTPSDGWAWAGSAGTGAVALMLTTDGGATWADSRLPTEDSVEEVTMLSSGSLRVLVRDEAKHRFELWITDDRGATWFQAPLPDLSYVLSAVAHVAFPTGQVGYVSFARSDAATKDTVAIYRSADGGRSWTRLPGEGLGVAQTTSPGFLQALDERQLWLAAGSALYFSADGEARGRRDTRGRSARSAPGRSSTSAGSHPRWSGSSEPVSPTARAATMRTSTRRRTAASHGARQAPRRRARSPCSMVGPMSRLRRRGSNGHPMRASHGSAPTSPAWRAASAWAAWASSIETTAGSPRHSTAPKRAMEACQHRTATPPS